MTKAEHSYIYITYLSKFSHSLGSLVNYWSMLLTHLFTVVLLFDLYALFIC